MTTPTCFGQYQSGQAADVRACDVCRSFGLCHQETQHMAMRKQLASSAAPALLDTAARHLRDRAATYDKPEGERSMSRTVAMFNAATGRDLTEVEGWFLLQCLKDVRFFQNPTTPHRDSLEDCIAYAALKAEAALK